MADNESLADVDGDRGEDETLVRVVDELRLRLLQLEVENEELRGAERTLERSQGRYADLWDWLPVGACVIDENGAIVQANVTAGRLFTTRLPPVGVSLARALGGEDDRDLHSIIQAVAAGAPRRTITDLTLASRGGVRVLQLAVQRMPGPAVRLAVVFTDVSERKRTIDVLQFLADAGRELAGVLDAGEIASAAVRLAVPFLADIAIVDLLEPGGFRRAAALHRDPARQLLIADDSEPGCAVHPRIRGAAVRALAEAGTIFVSGLKDAISDAQIGRARRQLLARLEIRACLVVPLQSGGRNHGVLLLMDAESGRGAGADDRRLAESFGQRVSAAIASAALHAQLVDLNRVKDEFLARVSHELRTPIATVLMWLQALRAGIDDRTERVRAFDAVERAARLQARMVEDLVDLARGMAGKLGLVFERLRIAEPLRHALETLEHEQKAKRIRVEISGADLPIDVWGDGQRLGQVFTNLLQNAYKFSPADSRVSVTIAADGDNVRVVIADEGSGIAPEVLPTIFEMFRQAVEGGAGLGIGLAIVRQVVALHGGTVQAASDGPGKGSTFSVELPIFLDDGETTTAPPPLEGRQLLIAQAPSPERARITRAFLEQGARVVFSDNGAAPYFIGPVTPDVLLCDLGSAGDCGMGLVKSMRAAKPEQRLVAIAVGDHAAVTSERALAGGFDAYLAAPTPAELVELVVRLARRR